eukprot:gene17303-47374_t
MRATSAAIAAMCCASLPVPIPAGGPGGGSICVRCAPVGSCGLPPGDARQGAAAVVWRGAVILVAGSWAPRCGPSGIVHLDDVVSFSEGTGWRPLGALGRAHARTHHAAAVVGDVLVVLGGFGGNGGGFGDATP